MVMEAITFDFWNTLYKTNQKSVLHDIRINGLMRVLQSAGLDVGTGEVFEVFKKVWLHAFTRQRAYGEEVPPARQLELILEKFDITLSEELKQNAYYYYAETLLEYPPEMNTDVKETLPLLYNRYKLAVICNTGLSPGYVLRKLMKKDGIIDFFEYLTFSDELGIAKPNPGIFEFTLEKMNIESHQAAHIGDDMITDVVGAKKAGMTAIWLAPAKDWKIPEADYHLRTVKELLNLW